MYEKLHDRLIELSGLYQLISINEKLSCNKEVFESVIKSSKFKKKREYSNDPVKIKKRGTS